MLENLTHFHIMYALGAIGVAVSIFLLRESWLHYKGQNR